MWSWPRQISISTRKTHCIFSPVKWYKSCIGSINNYITWFEYKHTLYWTYNVSAGWYGFMENCCRLKVRVLSSITVDIIHCSRWCQIRWECREARRESWWLCTSSRSTWWSSSRAGTCLFLTHTIILSLYYMSLYIIYCIINIYVSMNHNFHPEEQEVALFWYINYHW